MTACRMKAGGKHILIIGLPRQVISEIQNGKVAKMDSHNAPDILPTDREIHIWFGETDDDIKMELKKRGIITDATPVSDTRRKNN